MIKSISELTEKELGGKRVLLRVDFNVPVDNGKISEIYRINAARKTINYLLSHNASIALLSHITAIKSFSVKGAVPDGGRESASGGGPIYNQIKTVLGFDFKFLPDCIGGEVEKNIFESNSKDIFLLENIRRYEGEEKNDKKFAKKLAKPFDIYINDAFSESHRSYASVAAITEFLPSYGGFLLMKEIKNLAKAIETPKKGKTLILGGAKIETKFPVIKNFFDKAENILIGGAVANVFLKAKGIAIGESLTDDNFLESAKNLIGSKEITVPEDYIDSECMILDIGQKTTAKFSKIIAKSKVVIWNGPLGKYEIEQFSGGTSKVAKAIIKSGAFSVIGGGDTIAFLEKANLIYKFNYVSTGGGAMLQFLAGAKLPGLEALGYYGS